MTVAVKVIDMAPYIRKALDETQIEIKQGLEAKVADELRSRGWTCIPPSDGDPAEG